MTDTTEPLPQVPTPTVAGPTVPLASVYAALDRLADPAAVAADDGLRAAHRRLAEGAADVVRSLLATAATTPPDDPAELARERAARAAAEADVAALRDEQARLRHVIDALRPDPAAPGVPAPTPDRSADEVARRDEVIATLGEHLRARDAELAEERARRRAAERGGLDETETREREGYEAGRTGPGRLWAAVAARSLPAVPACAAGVAAVVRATGAMRFGPAFAVASAAGLAVLAVAVGVGVWAYWAEVGPRWVWFRSRNARAGVFDVLTSTGGRVQGPPGEFTLEVSALLESAGLGTVRRAATGVRYATTEPAAWRAHLPPGQVRRRWGVDVVTAVVLVAWVAAVVACLA